MGFAQVAVCYVSAPADSAAALAILREDIGRENPVSIAMTIITDQNV